MSGFGQAPIFGAQAPSASSSSPSPFGAPSTQAFSAPTPFPGAAQQSLPSSFGAPSPFSTSLGQQSPATSIFGAANSSNQANGNRATSTVPSAGETFPSAGNANQNAAMNNPFAAATSAPSGSVSNPFAAQTQASNNVAITNPFSGAAPSLAPHNEVPAANPFDSARAASPFASTSNGADSRTTSGFGQPSQQPGSAPPSFATAAPSYQKRKNVFDDKTRTKPFDSRPDTPPFQASRNSSSTTNGFGGFGGKDTGKETSGFGGTQPKIHAQNGAYQGQKKSPQVYAKEIRDQLRKENIKPPPWPSNPGDPNNLKEMDDYRVKYKKYEGRVRECLIKAGYIDDPNVRKKLSDAIDFRGICEDMCPEGEKVSRIVEHDVKLPERVRSNGPDNGFADPSLMVKSFKRSAAGMDSPLPTEVRSPAALRRTLDYLVNDVLSGDENLPVMHGFLWDRTRAIRKDFIFQNAMSPEERMDQIYCLENITRFHAVSLHLLSRDGKDDFSEQQEREQLGKTLLSLIQVYDECKDMNLKLDNEAEFRAYYLLFNAHDPFVIQQMQDWDDKFWSDSMEIQTAVTLIEVMRNTWSGRGPLRPAAPLTTGSASFGIYFSIVEDPKVSYTMACLAEIHFTEIRRLVLKSIHRSHGRVRDGPKDLTAKVLNELFCFDTEEECVAFLKDLDMEFSSEGASEPYLIVERRRSLPAKTIKQSFSQTMVERKRGSHALPDVIHSTVFEEASSIADRIDSPNGLFVTQPHVAPKASESQPAFTDMNFSDDESPSSSPAPTRNSLVQPPTSMFTTGASSSQTNLANGATSIAKNPFFSQPSTLANTTTSPSSGTPSATTKSAFSPWAGAETSTSVLQQPLTSQQPLQDTPKFSWTSSQTTAPAVSSSSANPFDFLKQPTRESKPALFPQESGSGTAAVATGLFGTPQQSQTKNETPSIGEATANTSEGLDISKSLSSSAKADFSTPPASESAPVSSLFAAVAPKPESPAGQAPKAMLAPPFKPQSSVQASEPTQPELKSMSQTPAKPKDLMGNLAKWVVLGDGGTMEQLQEMLVEKLVREAYENHLREEAERKKREEDEASWREAQKFRRYSLGVKFFYRWREVARRKALKRVGHLNKTKLKAYREAKAAEARAGRKKKEREEQARLKRLTVPPSWLDELEKERAVKRVRRESMSLATSGRSSPVSDADALLATGIFGGMPNQHEIATSCVGDDDSIYDALIGVHISPDSSRQIMGPPAKPTKDPLRSVRDAGISKPAPKQKWSKKGQALADLLSGKRQEDDLISFRSSTSSRLGQSVRSVPGRGKLTNFSKYQSPSSRSSAEPERSRTGPSSGIKTPYWLLRSQGLFATPTGHVLSEKAPRPRTDSFHDGASQYSEGSEMGDYDDRVLEQDGAYRASLGLTGAALRRNSFSVGAAGSPPRSGFVRTGSSSFRQSLPVGGLSTDALKGRPRRDTDTASQAGSAMSTMQQDVEETLRELRKVAAEMDQDTNWYREQNKQLSHSRDMGN